MSYRLCHVYIQLTFSLKRRESEPSQVVVLCCLALFIVSPLFNHVQYVNTLCRLR